MHKDSEELIIILNGLLNQEENECVEFKRAENNFNIDLLGKYFSALSNEANLHNKQYSWLIFGIDDKTHDIIGTNFYNDNNFNKVKKQISDNTTDNIGFIDIYSVDNDGKRIVFFQIPAAIGNPIMWKGYAYGRSGESLVPLSSNKIEQIKLTADSDFTRKIIDNASIDNLDIEAVKIAREKFKEKYSDMSSLVDNMSDLDFLDKVGLTLNGKITYACMLLLGSSDYSYLLGDFDTRMTWKLYDERGFTILDYEHFGIPFLTNSEKIKGKIRNLKYRYIVNPDTIFPSEVDRYNPYIFRELLNNCIVHTNYKLRGYINIMEYKDKLVFTNEGSFIPKNVENVLKDNFSSPYYRNPFLAKAMVNLNMIDTVGSGIRKIYDIQREKYFPMPDYDLSEENRVIVTLYGTVLDQNYSEILFKNTNLSLETVVLLDKVQKKYSITKKQSDYLRKLKLIDGRYPNIFVSSGIAEVINMKNDYMENKGLDNKYYMDYILEYINKFGRATREEINKLIYPKLPKNMTDKNKNNRVRYLLNILKKENKIKNVGSDKTSIWIFRD